MFCDGRLWVLVLVRGCLGVLAFAGMSLIASPAAHAYPSYVGSVLNGSTYKCVTCHTSQYGGYPADGVYSLNAFGLAFQSNAHTWNSTLWLQDSDGDGYNNYTELNNNRLPGQAKSGSNFYFTCYSAPAALYGELASTYGSYYLSTSASAGGAPCGASGAAYNNVPQFELNECSIGIDTCDNSPVASCTNTVGVYPSFTCGCPSGYSPSGSPSGSVCSDINECTLGTDLCDNSPIATCTNTTGGYFCTCPGGYSASGSPSGQICTNINECVLGTDLCDNSPVATCTDTTGSYTCACPSGYSPSGTPSGQVCTNINECVLGTDLCDDSPVATCADTVGAYTCTCPSGYSASGSPSGQICTNINECATANLCDPGYPLNTIGGDTCVDNAGGYSCTCPAGYVFNGVRCVVSDACVVNPGACDTHATCMPVGMTFTCSACNSGWTGAGTPGTCVDVNECLTNNGGCSVNALCSNTAGSRTCLCNAGYAGNGVTCNDEDECTLNTDNCYAPHALCANTIGSFTCSCGAGYTGNGTTTCDDVDECTAGLNNCHSRATCTNTDGAFTCACLAGYTGNGTTCTDVDECLTNNGGCSADATCANTPGDRTCTCNAGYAGNGISCADIDECTTNNGGCDAHAICKNTVGSRTCTCASGYSGDGFACSEIDECALDTDDCAPTGGVCSNMPAGYFTCTCATGFQGIGTICVDVNDCTGNACGANEICINQLGIPHTCDCLEGYQRPTPGAPCVSACGNGERVSGEDCDDGNTTSGDGCSENCLIEPGYACFEPTPNDVSACSETCGDGLIDPPHETCDDGAANSDTTVDGCRTNCRVAHCGDGVVDSDEACDEGTGNSDTLPGACRTSCREAFCGDGVIDSVNGEVCEPGGGSPVAASLCANLGCQPIIPDGGVADAHVDAGQTPPSRGGCGACRAGDAPRTHAQPSALAYLGALLLIVVARTRRGRDARHAVDARETRSARRNS